MTVSTLPVRPAEQQYAGALAIRPDQTTWSPEQAAVLRQTGIDDDVAPAELSAFLHLCQRTQLDPFSRQIYLIGRWDKKQKRKVYTPQTGIDGYRVIAHRVASESRQSFGYEDTLWCDQSGRWRDAWLADTPPAAAKVTVLRNGERFSAVARFSEYVQTFPDGNPSGLWGRMPSGQIAKCAEALALRKAFPHDLAGIYTAEEMAQADTPDMAEIERLTPQGARQVQHSNRAEPGPWEQPPAELAPEGEPEHPDYLAKARACRTVAEARAVWQKAKADGAPGDYLAQIAEIGSSLPDAEPEAAPAEPVAEPIEPAAVVTSAERQPSPRERLAALAKRAGLTRDDVEQECQTLYATPLAETTDANLTALADTIERGMGK